MPAVNLSTSKRTKKHRISNEEAPNLVDEGVEISYSSHQQQDHGSRQQQLTDASCLPEETAAIQSNLGLDQSES